MAETSQTFDLRHDLTAGEVKSWMDSVPTYAHIEVETGIVGHYTNERMEPVRIKATWRKAVVNDPLSEDAVTAHMIEHHAVHPFLVQAIAPWQLFAAHHHLHREDAKPEPDHVHEAPFPPSAERPIVETPRYTSHTLPVGGRVLDPIHVQDTGQWVQWDPTKHLYVQVDAPLTPPSKPSPTVGEKHG